MDIYNLAIFNFFGLVGSSMLFFSWLLQSYESKKNGKSIVSKRFWWMRFVAILFLGVHYTLRHDFVSLLLMFATMILIVYNLFLSYNLKKS